MTFVWAPIGTVIESTPTVKNEFSLNVAAGVAYNGKTTIHIFKENMDRFIFRDILQHTIISGGNKLLGRNWKLYMDNDPKHTSHLCRDYLEQQGVKRIPTPGQSPDLNIQENVWSFLIEEMKNKRQTNEAQLRKAIKSAWEKIPQFKIQNAIDSMDHRLQLVRKAKGGHIIYH